MPGLMNSNLLQRVVSALVLLPGLAFLVVWESPWGFALLNLFVILGVQIELGNLVLGTGRKSLRVGMAVLGTAVAAVLYLWPDLGLATVAFGGFFAAILTMQKVAGELVTSKPENAGAVLGAPLFMVLYGSVCFILPSLMKRDVENGRWWLLTAFFATFMCDTGAYFAGKTLGRRKLAPRLSPGKTVEGAVGGAIGAVLGVWVVQALFASWLTALDVVAVGVVAGIVGPYGDLFESALKRCAGVKDSGKLIPGHGGLLDRLDALVFIAAFVYLYSGYLRPLFGP